MIDSAISELIVWSQGLSELVRSLPVIEVRINVWLDRKIVGQVGERNCKTYLMRKKWEENAISKK